MLTKPQIIRAYLQTGSGLPDAETIGENIASWMQSDAVSFEDWLSTYHQYTETSTQTTDRDSFENELKKALDETKGLFFNTLEKLAD